MCASISACLQVKLDFQPWHATGGFCIPPDSYTPSVQLPVCLVTPLLLPARCPHACR
jgi:hypothetical protein